MPENVRDFPNDWRVVSLGSLAEVNYGKARPKEPGDIPVVGSGGIYNWADRSLVEEPTLVIGRKGSAGSVYLMEQPCWPSDTTFYLDLGEEVDIYFLFGYLTHNSLAKKSSQTTLPSLSRPDVEESAIPFPPIREQRNIAGALRTIQEAIAAQDKVIEAARDLKRSLMERLFTYGPGREPAPTKETEIGEIPEHWSLKTLGAFAKIGNGSTPKRGNAAYWVDGTIPWITSGKVHEEIISSADEFVTEKAQDECHLPLVPSGSLVVAITGQGKTLGNAALVTFDTCLNQHLAYLKFKDNSLLVRYVLAYLQRQYSHLRYMGRAGGSTKGALTCGLLKTYPIPIPPKNEQTQIVDISRVVRKKVDTEQRRKSALEELFRSALEQLMTGQIRLPV